jgi:hypothetical protein
MHLLLINLPGKHADSQSLNASVTTGGGLVVTEVRAQLHDVETTNQGFSPQILPASLQTTLYLKAALLVDSRFCSSTKLHTN